ncbi:hypothetical protein RSAG8_10701, partial [Rhizoctonia solani AG-8 WAC10335]
MWRTLSKVCLIIQYQSPTIWLTRYVRKEGYEIQEPCVKCPDKIYLPKVHRLIDIYGVV